VWRVKVWVPLPVKVWITWPFRAIVTEFTLVPKVATVAVTSPL